MSVRRAFVCAITAVLLVGVAPILASSAEAADMTPEQAGAYYLTHECKNGLALFLFLDELSRDGVSIRFADVKKRFSRFKKEARRLGAAETRFATNLLNPPDVWPVTVSSQVATVADAGLKSATILRRAGQASTPSGWWRKFGKANKHLTAIENGKTEIRALLGIPPTDC